VDVGAALVADQQATEPVQPSDAAALHYPALATEAGALLGRATADLRRAAAGTQPPPVEVVVVAAVREQAIGTSSPPFLACTWLESATAREKSISPAARKRASSRACSLSQTPARCHSSRRRQQVMPEPKPS